MNRNRWTWPVIAAALLALPLCAQDDEKKKRDPEVAEQLETFEKAIADSKFERDAEAVQLIEDLLKKQKAGMHEKDEHDFLKALGKVFTQRPRKPEQPQLYTATVACLGEIGGPVASRTLVTMVVRKPFDDQEWLSLQELMFENIGKTKDERQIDFLVKSAVRDPVDQIKKAAGKALRHFEDADLKTRQSIFKDLLTNYGQIHGDANASLDPGDALVATRRRTLAAIADAWNQTLGALSGQSFQTAPQWYEWWNDHKNDPKAWK
jgi:hypothetical protein